MLYEKLKYSFTKDMNPSKLIFINQNIVALTFVTLFSFLNTFPCFYVFTLIVIPSLHLILYKVGKLVTIKTKI